MDAAARSQIASGLRERGIAWPTSSTTALMSLPVAIPAPAERPRLLGYARRVGGGAVTYLALGHCHNSYARMGRTAGGGSQQLAPFREPWESEAFFDLLSNTIAGSTGTTS